MHLRISRSIGRLARLAILGGLMLAATGVQALQPATPLLRLSRQAWTMENGLPQNTVSVLMQSHSGYLWVGTEVGLARFDGTTFRIFDHTSAPPFPDAEIRCLLDGPNGGLWVGTADGLAHFADDSSAPPTLLTTHDGLPGNSILGLARTNDGIIWAWTDAGLAQTTGGQSATGKFTAVPLPAGVSPNITSLAAGTGDELWVGTTTGPAMIRHGLWTTRLPSSIDGAGSIPSSSRVAEASGGDVLIGSAVGVFVDHSGVITPVPGTTGLFPTGIRFLTRLPSGTIAAATEQALVLLPSAGSLAAVSRFATGKQLPGARIESLLADREGSLWVGTNHGLARIVPTPKGPSVELLPSTDPLGSDAIASLVEDAEGDMWAGTETAGLHILRDTRFRTLGSGDGLSSDETTAIVEDAHGALWVGTRDSGLNRIVNGQVAVLTTANGLLSNVILSLAAAPSGDLWVGTPDGLNRIREGKITSLTSADGLPDDFIRSVLVAPDTTLWVGTRRGLTHLDRSNIRNYTHADGLGNDLIGALTLDRAGDLWIATLNGLSRLHRGVLHNYTTADGLSSNVITALNVGPFGNLWIGTQNNGLNVWDGQHFVALNPRSGQLPAAIHALVHDDRNYLWLASDSGLTRTAITSLIACAQQPVCRPDAVAFTTADGLRSRETSNNSHPTACRRSNGEIWFTTPRGLIAADPMHFPSLPAAPPVAIERFAVDDHDIDRSQAPRTTAGALRLQFDYAGLSFAAPQKLRYQYTLDNFDHGWTDAGTRRTAYYTNLPPGHYRFRVRAAFTDFTTESPSDTASYTPSGISETALEFDLLPRFYQTWWFRSAVLLAAVALIVLAVRRRVLRVERELGAVMRERNRIAREIHDTLAQGYVGISLQLEILGQLLRYSQTEPAMQHLSLTQQLVREGLDDARQSIWALRSHDANEQTLPIRLRRLVEQAQTTERTTHLEVHGAYRPLPPETEKEILRIAQEAIQNVRLHSEASHLNVRLDYDTRRLELTVADNGKGFPASDTSPQGHYGLTGMRERATLIGANLDVTSAAGEGTTVRLNLSAPEAAVKDM